MGDPYLSYCCINSKSATKAKAMGIPWLQSRRLMEAPRHHQLDSRRKTGDRLVSNNRSDLQDDVELMWNQSGIPCWRWQPCRSASCGCATTTPPPEKPIHPPISPQPRVSQASQSLRATTKLSQRKQSMMPPAPRRTHRKSRAGCFACKRRRVKVRLFSGNDHSGNVKSVL